MATFLDVPWVTGYIQTLHWHAVYIACIRSATLLNVSLGQGCMLNCQYLMHSGSMYDPTIAQSIQDFKCS